MRNVHFARILNVLGILLLVVVGWHNYQRTRDLIAQNREVIHGQRVIQSVSNVLISIQRSETGQRGFLLTGEEDYLEPYLMGVAAVQQELDRLEDAFGNDTEQLVRFQNLEAAVGARLAELEEALRLRREEGLPAALDVLKTDEGQRLMREIRGLANDMIERQQALLEAGRRAAEAKSNRALTLLQASIALAAFLFLTSGLLITWDLLRSNRRLTDLSESLDFLSDVLAAHPAATAVIAPDGQVASGNLDRTGALESARGPVGNNRTYQQIVREYTGHQGTMAHDLESGIEAVLSGELREFERRISGDMAGEQKYFTVHAKPMAVGGQRHALLCITDVTTAETALETARFNEERLEMALHGGGLGTWDWRLSDNHVRFDTRWAGMLGYSVAELPPALSTWDELVHPDDRDPVLADLGRHLRGETKHFQAEQRLRHKDGSWVWIQANGKVIARDETGAPLRACGTHLDITARKAAEEQLARFSRELERSNRELEDFAYIASHDLKEPLRGIGNYARFLLEDYEEKLDDDGRDKLHTLVKLAARLEQFIDDLLRYSRVGREEINLAPVDLHALVLHSIESLQGWLAERNGRVTIRGRLPETHCHPVLAPEVFRNLITNGIKYNDAEIREVEIGAEEGTAGEMVFYVRDNGIGIPEKHHPAVFRIFKRLHGRDKYGGGTGAGLSITEKIVRRHGGRIWLESAPGAGTTFYFTLSNGEVHDE